MLAFKLSGYRIIYFNYNFELCVNITDFIAKYQCKMKFPDVIYLKFVNEIYLCADTKFEKEKIAISLRNY